MIEHPLAEALTFDDVLLIPAYSEVAPAQVSTQTHLTKNIPLTTPLNPGENDIEFTAKARVVR